jgi:hypothetical protein
MEIRLKKKRKLSFLGAILIGLLPAAACNLPVRAIQPSYDSDRATLVASLFNTQTPDSSLNPVQPLATDVSALPTAQISPFQSLATIGPGETAATFYLTPPPEIFFYYSLPGDTLPALTKRFAVAPQQIVSQGQLPPTGFIPVGQVLTIPNLFEKTTPAYALLPDSEIVFGPSTIDFDIQEWIRKENGYLAAYSETVEQDTLSGAEIVHRVALETSINPRILLAVLDFRAGWVSGQPSPARKINFPIGFEVPQYTGLYKELILTARQLTIGYYGWRSGDITQITFTDSSQIRIAPTLNAGSAAIQYLFATLYKPVEWEKALYLPDSFIQFYQSRYGDPWQRAVVVEPILPADLQQPVLELPFLPGLNWSFSGGPHIAWGTGSPRGALDFAPASTTAGCTVSSVWATASAPGLVIRSDNAVVILDLDGDGFEQTGWVLLYLHIAEQDRIPAGTWLETDDYIGHPSCEGGKATGTHVHITRKYHGEWISADGPVPFTMSGWQVTAGDLPFSGTLTKDGLIVTSRPDGSHTSIIRR